MLLPILSLAFTLPIPLVSSPPDPISLDNGVRAIILQVPDAASQSFFTFFPVGLAHDDADRTQYAHLVEHMLIRSTDPDGLHVDGIRINGETTTSVLRLETIGPADRWRDALARHAAWLSADEFTADVLEREKGRIAGEADSTVPAGYTHKWAVAAWNQVVRHGRSHAALIGAIEDATVDDVQAYVASRVPVGEDVLVVAVGPVPVDEVEAALRRGVGAVDRRPSSPTTERDASDVEFHGDHDGTWDLDAHHYMAWYPARADDPNDRVAIQLLSQALLQSIYGEAQAAGVQAMVSADLVAADGAQLVVSVGGFGAEQADDIRALVDNAMDSARRQLAHYPVSMALRNFVSQVVADPDYAALRDQFAGRPGADLLEAQLTLSRVYVQLHTGLSFAELGRACDDVTPESFADLADRVLDGPRGTLLLRPKAQE